MRFSVAGSQAAPAALTLKFAGAVPPAVGSVAENFTVTGVAYVRPAPGELGSSVPVVTGASVSLFGAVIVNATVLMASTLPALSVERYSIV